MRIPESELFIKVRLETNSEDCHVSCHNDFFILFFKLLVSSIFKKCLIVGQAVLCICMPIGKELFAKKQNNNLTKYMVNIEQR